MHANKYNSANKLDKMGRGVVCKKIQHNKHTGQCKRTGGCYNELVVAFFNTGGGVIGKKSIPVAFIIYL